MTALQECEKGRVPRPFLKAAPRPVCRRSTRRDGFDRRARPTGSCEDHHWHPRCIRRYRGRATAPHAAACALCALGRGLRAGSGPWHHCGRAEGAMSMLSRGHRLHELGEWKVSYREQGTARRHFMRFPAPGFAGANAAPIPTLAEQLEAHSQLMHSGSPAGAGSVLLMTRSGASSAAAHVAAVAPCGDQGRGRGDDGSARRGAKAPRIEFAAPARQSEVAWVLAAFKQTGHAALLDLCIVEAAWQDGQEAPGAKSFVARLRQELRDGGVQLHRNSAFVRQSRASGQHHALDGSDDDEADAADAAVIAANDAGTADADDGGEESKTELARPAWVPEGKGNARLPSKPNTGRWNAQATAAHRHVGLCGFPLDDSTQQLRLNGLSCSRRCAKIRRLRPSSTNTLIRLCSSRWRSARGNGSDEGGGRCGGAVATHAFDSSALLSGSLV